MEIKANYKSSFFVVIVPSILAILVIAGMIYLGVAVIEIEHVWQSLLLLAGTMVAVIVMVVVTYPVINSIAGHKKGTLSIENNILSWQTGSDQKSIDLTKKYSATVYAGHAFAHLGKSIDCAVIMFETADNSITLTLRHIRPSEIIEMIDDPNFTFDYSFTPESGIASFDLSGENQVERSIFMEVLGRMWEYRNSNIAFILHQKFPWQHSPQPELPYTVILDSSDPVDAGKIDSIKKNAFIKYHGRLFGTEDYILVSMDTSMADLVQAVISPGNGTEYYCCMPVGYTEAGIVEESQASGGSSATRSVHRLGIWSRDKDDKEIAVRLNWPKPGFENTENILVQTLIRFLGKKKIIV